MPHISYDIGSDDARGVPQVGLEWQVAGFGDFSGNPDESDMLMRDSNNGAFEVYDISNNQITSAAGLGQVGLEWTVAGFATTNPSAGSGASAALIAQLDQAMASFGASRAVNSEPVRPVGGADMSQRTLLAIPH